MCKGPLCIGWRHSCFYVECELPSLLLAFAMVGEVGIVIAVARQIHLQAENAPPYNESRSVPPIQYAFSCKHPVNILRRVYVDPSREAPRLW